jgi:polyphosphate kinase 2 (PPK2 family)
MDKRKDSDRSSGEASTSDAALRAPQAGEGKRNGEKKNGNHDKGGNGSKYEDRLRPLQVQLEFAMEAIKTRGERVLLLFEGRDTAGKGGVIHAVSERLNPRRCRVVAMGVPAIASSRSGTSSASCRTCPRLASWCSSIAAGTTARAWRR